MNADQITSLAKQAGLGRETPDDYFIAVWSANPTSLQRFAELVRNAALEDAINACKEYAAIPKVDSGVPLAIANRIGLLK